MNTIKETGEEARQGEVSRKRPVLKVLLASISIAAIVLLLASALMV